MPGKKKSDIPNFTEVPRIFVESCNDLSKLTTNSVPSNHNNFINALQQQKLLPPKHEVVPSSKSGTTFTLTLPDSTTETTLKLSEKANLPQVDETVGDYSQNFDNICADFQGLLENIHQYGQNEIVKVAKSYLALRYQQLMPDCVIPEWRHSEKNGNLPFRYLATELESELERLKNGCLDSNQENPFDVFRESVAALKHGKFAWQYNKSIQLINNSSEDGLSRFDKMACIAEEYPGQIRYLLLKTDPLRLAMERSELTLVKKLIKTRLPSKKLYGAEPGIQTWEDYLHVYRMKSLINELKLDEVIAENMNTNQNPIPQPTKRQRPQTPNITETNCSFLSPKPTTSFKKHRERVKITKELPPTKKL